MASDLDAKGTESAPAFIMTSGQADELITSLRAIETVLKALDTRLARIDGRFEVLALVGNLLALRGIPREAR